MDNKPKTTAKDFFLYLGITIGLYASDVSFLNLVFTIIDKVFPLAGDYTGGYENTIRICIATLIIFFPTFFYLTWLIYKDLKVNPEKKEIWVRKWMIFLNLFIAGLTAAIDLAVLIYQFLGAEDLTLRFFLKVFFVLASAVTIFVFYLYNLKRPIFEYKDYMNIFLAFISAVILASIIYGIILIGSPASQKAKQLDEQRISDLSNIQNQIVYVQWETKGTVPTSLSELNDPISGFIVPTDPQTGESYIYKMISTSSFELCANFKTVATTSNQNTIAAAPVSYPIQTNSINENWQHEATTTCFTRVIDATLYPVNTKK